MGVRELNCNCFGHRPRRTRVFVAEAVSIAMRSDGWPTEEISLHYFFFPNTSVDICNFPSLLPSSRD